MAKQLFANNASTTVAEFLSPASTTIRVASSGGFPNPTNGDWFLATIVDQGVVEIIKVTGVNGNVWTVQRGQEGTPARSWLLGATIECRVTAGTLDNLQLVGPDGASKVGLENGTVADAIGYITPEMFGAAGDGVADDTAAINLAANACRDRSACLASYRGSYRISGEVNLRGIAVDFADARINVDSGGVLIIGGYSDVDHCLPQVIGYARQTVSNPTNPSVIVKGAKGGLFTVSTCDYLMLYADSDDPRGDSIAYNTFNLGWVRRLHITNNADTTGSLIQWINANRFNLTRTSFLVVDGTYSHNQNWFEGGGFEGPFLIDFAVGHSNTMNNVRVENAAGASIHFGPGTWSNRVIQSWDGNQRSFIEPATGVGLNIITDESGLNSVVRTSDLVHRRERILDISPATLLAVSTTEDMTNLAGVRVLASDGASFLAGSNPIYADPQGLFAVSKGVGIVVEGAESVLNMRLYIYNSSRELLTVDQTTAATYVLPSAGVSWSTDGFWATNTARNVARFVILSDVVAFARVEIRAATGSVITRIGIDRLNPRPDTLSAVSSLARPIVPRLAAAPNTAIAPQGEWVLVGSTPTICTLRTTRTLENAYTASSTTIVVTTSISALAVGDVVGAQGKWAKISAITLGTRTIELTAPLGVNLSAGTVMQIARWE